jgi:membrane protease YdiL (CAAX protease family)
MGALIAGVAEESAFRGYMQRPIERRHGLMVAVLITGTTFAVAHLDFTSNLYLWLYGRAEWQAPAGSVDLVWSTGVDPSFLWTATELLVGAAAMGWACRRLASVSRTRSGVRRTAGGGP